MDSAPTSKVSKSKKPIIIVIFLLLFFCCAVIVGAAVMLVVLNKPAPTTTVNPPTSGQNDTQDEPEEETELELQSKDFKGKYVQATIPNDWTIKEYENEQGLEAYITTEGVTYSGLTGLEIVDENQVLVFSFKGIDGVGGAGGCMEVAKFADTEASYIQQIQNDTQEVGFEPSTVLDLTAEEYSVIFTLDLRMRRVDNVVYIASPTNQTVFNPYCGIDAQYVRIPELGYVVNDGGESYTLDSYSFGINTVVTSEETLAKLDDVLNTLQKIN